MWGQVRQNGTYDRIARIIPTRVGTSHCHNSLTSTTEDHPHACGDKGKIKWLQRKVQGSSPRVWGQGGHIARGERRRGIIPTRVGTRERIFISSDKQKDHPHACGDKYHQILSESIQRGSSPRVWGQAVMVEGCTDITRIIPTRVGTRIFITEFSVIV